MQPEPTGVVERELPFNPVTLIGARQSSGESEHNHMLGSQILYVVERAYQGI